VAMEWDRLLSAKRVRELFNGSITPKDKGDLRSAFDQDYGRAVFSTPVRRLQDKAQVFPLDPCDAVRTRLTHSMEVSSVARDIARAVSDWLVEIDALSAKDARSLETIAATCGLIHDLGNPPFGHAGERAISDWIRKKNESEDILHDLNEQQRQDFLKFEGNAQTIRLTAKLQVLSDHHGLNFTSATMSAACKYIAASHQINEEQRELKKPGFFASESNLIERIRQETETGTARHPLCYLIEAADDICYLTVDLEDATKKGVIRWNEIKELVRNANGATIIDRAKNYLDQNPGLASSAHSSESDNLHAQAFRTFAIGSLVVAAIDSFKSNYEQIITGEFHDELMSTGTASGLASALAEFAKKRVYCCEDNLRLEVMGRKVIWDLMDLFWEAAKNADDSGVRGGFAEKLYNLMSSNYRGVFEQACGKDSLPLRYHQLQLVTDYVCGMTDTFACSLHRQLCNG